MPDRWNRSRRSQFISAVRLGVAPHSGRIGGTQTAIACIAHKSLEICERCRLSIHLHAAIAMRKRQRLERKTNASMVSDSHRSKFRHLLTSKHFHVEFWVLRSAFGVTGFESRRHTIRLYVSNQAGGAHAHNQIVCFHVVVLVRSMGCGLFCLLSLGCISRVSDQFPCQSSLRNLSSCR